jgi:Ca2+-binding EF-hand superfamily protein
MISNNLTLWGVFNQFDEKKGSLNYQEFAGLLKKICGNSIEISQDEIKSGFDLIDEDGSGTISFNELDKYYSRVNGIHQMNTNQNKIIAGNPQPSQQYSPGKKY